MKKIIISLILLSFVLLSGCGGADDGNGTGEIVKEGKSLYEINNNCTVTNLTKHETYNDNIGVRLYDTKHLYTGIHILEKVEIKRVYELKDCYEEICLPIKNTNETICNLERTKCQFDVDNSSFNKIQIDYYQNSIAIRNHQEKDVYIDLIYSGNVTTKQCINNTLSNESETGEKK